MDTDAIIDEEAVAGARTIVIRTFMFHRTKNQCLFWLYSLISILNYIN